MKKLEKKQMLMLSGGSKGFWNGVCTALMLSGVGATVVVGGALACVVYQGYNN